MRAATSIDKFTGTQRETDLYLRGLRGEQPLTTVSLATLEARAREIMDARAYDYVAGGAGGERTMRANLEAFYRWRIVPRMLRDVSQRDMSLRLFGRTLPAPLLLGPIGVQGIIHRDAEIATARAAASLGIPFCLSTVASRSIEEVAQAMDGAPHWFQLYWSSNRDVTASLLHRAEKSGYAAIVVTLDTFMLAWRERDLQHGYLPFLLGEGLANYLSDPAFTALLPQVGDGQRKIAAIRVWSEIFSEPSLTWADLPFLREHTRLPIVLKGILHPDDARRALDAGVDGIICSNHGGRQVDGAIAALDALPEIVDAVAGRAPVLFDSGIRHGADMFKALALGAAAVLIARPYAWGLAAGGEQGVRDVVLNLLADFDLTLALSGCASLAEVTREALGREVASGQ